MKHPDDRSGRFPPGPESNAMRTLDERFAALEARWQALPDIKADALSREMMQLIRELKSILEQIKRILR